MEGNPVITLELKDGPYSRSMWDFSFQALYKVSWSLPSYENIVQLGDTDKSYTRSVGFVVNCLNKRCNLMP